MVATCNCYRCAQLIHSQLDHPVQSNSLDPHISALPLLPELSLSDGLRFLCMPTVRQPQPAAHAVSARCVSLERVICRLPHLTRAFPVHSAAPSSSWVARLLTFTSHRELFPVWRARGVEWVVKVESLQWSLGYKHQQWRIHLYRIHMSAMSRRAGYAAAYVPTPWSVPPPRLAPPPPAPPPQPAVACRVTSPPDRKLREPRRN